MDKILNDAKKELSQIEQVGLNAGNVDVATKMLSIIKNVGKIRKMEGEEMREYRDGGNYTYRGGDYEFTTRGRGNYRGDDYEGEYGRRGVPGSGRGRYSHYDDRMMERLDRIADGMEMYQYGRDRYRGGDSEERMTDGLEKMMYAVCTFVESAMDFAETPQEKEIIRKHIQKLAKM